MQGTGGSRETGKKGQRIRFFSQINSFQSSAICKSELLLNETPSKIVNSSLSFRIRAMDSHQPFKLFPA